VVNRGAQSAETLKRSSALALEKSPCSGLFSIPSRVCFVTRVRGADSSRLSQRRNLVYGLLSPLALPDEPLSCGGKGLPFRMTSPSNRPMACPFLTCIIVTVT
jgi:hypothetical protein